MYAIRSYYGYPFATNFNPEINIREITANGRYFENGPFVNKVFTVETLIKYDDSSMYRSGQTVKIVFEGRIEGS